MDFHDSHSYPDEHYELPKSDKPQWLLFAVLQGVLIISVSAYAFF